MPIYLFRYLLSIEVELGENIVRAKQSKHIRVAFMKEKSRLTISKFKNIYLPTAYLLDCSGL